MPNLPPPYESLMWLLTSYMMFCRFNTDVTPLCTSCWTGFLLHWSVLFASTLVRQVFHQVFSCLPRSTGLNIEMFNVARKPCESSLTRKTRQITQCLPERELKVPVSVITFQRRKTFSQSTTYQVDEFDNCLACFDSQQVGRIGSCDPALVFLELILWFAFFVACQNINLLHKPWLWATSQNTISFRFAKYHKSFNTVLFLTCVQNIKDLPVLGSSGANDMQICAKSQ